jgi:hypothetical protein
MQEIPDSDKRICSDGKIDIHTKIELAVSTLGNFFESTLSSDRNFVESTLSRDRIF